MTISTSRKSTAENQRLAEDRHHAPREWRPDFRSLQDFGSLHEHNVHFADATTPTSKAKPAGVRGCQIWVKIGTTPPASVSELNDLATDTRTPYVAQFDAADAGKTAYYWLRWENTKGETGPWSAVASATIPG